MTLNIVHTTDVIQYSLLLKIPIEATSDLIYNVQRNLQKFCTLSEIYIQIYLCFLKKSN